MQQKRRAKVEAEENRQKEERARKAQIQIEENKKIRDA
jgi:hypothetical protein